MKNRPRGFIAEDKIDHNGEIFDYIRELHNYLWRFVRAVNPSASGLLSDYVDEVLDDIESKRRTMSKQKKIHNPVTGTDYPVRDRKSMDEQKSKVCTYCTKPADGPMLIMGNNMAHTDCVLQHLNELLDYDYDGKGEPIKIVGYIREQEMFDKPDSISSVDELEKFYSWYGKRLDRPELREKQLAIDNILRNIRDAGWIACKKNGSVPEVYNARNKILALIPDIEEAKKQERERILTLLESYPLNQLQRFPTRVEIEQALKEEK